MTYYEHCREALKRCNLPIDDNAVLVEAAGYLPWFDDEFEPPDSKGLLWAAWIIVKHIAMAPAA